MPGDTIILEALLAGTALMLVAAAGKTLQARLVKARGGRQ